MKTSVMDVRDMLSVLSVAGVEKRIGEVSGVESVTVNFAAESATVRYDETRLDVADIRSEVRQSGFEGAAVPGAPAGEGSKAQAAPDAAPAMPPSDVAKPAGAEPTAVSATPKSPADDEHKDHAAPEKA